MKFRQLIEYNKRNIVLQNYTENEVGRLIPDLFFSFQKALFEVKANLVSVNFDSPQTGIQ